MDSDKSVLPNRQHDDLAAMECDSWLLEGEEDNMQGRFKHVVRVGS